MYSVHNCELSSAALYMNIVGKREDVVEKVDKDRRGIRRRKETAANSSTNRPAKAAAGERSTGPVDRPQ